MSIDKAAEAPQKVQKKVITGRSPAYPFISVRKALERAEEFRLIEGKHSVPVESAYKAWKYGGNSSNARQTVAAMRYYNLMESPNSGNVRLTKLALDILLDQQPNSIERQQLIKQSAMTPKIHKELWDKWQDELPSDATILTYLIRDRTFNEAAAKDLLSEYKDTLAFAKINKSDNMSSIETGTENDSNNDAASPTAQAENRYQQPVSVIKPLDKPSPEERHFLSGPLSKDGATYRLIVSGVIGPKELGKLIKLLTLQKEILEDSDDEEEETEINLA